MDKDIRLQAVSLSIEEAEVHLATGVSLWYEWDQAGCRFRTMPGRIVQVDVARNRMLIEHWETRWIEFDPQRVFLTGSRNG